MSQVSLDFSSLGQSREPLIAVRNLNVTFTKTRGSIRRKLIVTRAVVDVSFNLFESEVLTIVGESGSGKTTVARSILGLTRPTSGSIRYGELEVTKSNLRTLRKYRKNVQLIFQDPYESLSPRQDVYTSLSVPIKYLLGEKDSAKIQEIAVQLLEEVGLDPKIALRKFPHQLSGGERQRVCIARALASNPKLLVADEPITMLDAAQRMNVLSLLKELKSKRNLTLLLITHDLASAKVMSDRIMVMYSGRIVEAGPAEAVLSNPSHPYVKLISESTPSLQKSMETESSDGQLEDETIYETKGCVFRPRCPYATSICAEVEPKLRLLSEYRETACHNPLNKIPNLPA